MTGKHTQMSAQHEPKVTERRGLFSMTCGVEVNIRAGAPVIWALLIDAAGFPSWNFTVTQIEGEIREGEQIRIHAPGTHHTFRATISDVIPQQRMTWTGGLAPLFKGVRTFVLTPRADGSTDFAMRERFSGLLLPLLVRSLPDFRPIFAVYAICLRGAAERGGYSSDVHETS